MTNPKLTPKDLMHIRSDIEIINMMINLIDAIVQDCRTSDPNHYILSEVKAELQYMVDAKNQQIRLDTHRN